MFIESGTIKYIPLIIEFYFVLIIGFTSFVSGYYLFFFMFAVLSKKKPRLKTNMLLSYNNEFVRVVTMRKKKYLLITFFIAAFLQLGILFYTMFDLVGMQFDMGLYRYLLVDTGKPKFYILIILLNPFSYLLLVVTILFSHKKAILFLAVIVSVLFAFLATGRSNMLVISLFTIWALYFKDKLNYRKMFVLLIGFFSFFFIIGLLQGKINENYEGNFDYASDLIPHNTIGLAFLNISSYATSGIVAMSDFIANISPSYNFYFTANNFYKLFGIFFSSNPEYSVLPNAEVPFKTNVYSFFFSPYSDWGTWGVAVSFFLYGLIGAYLYRKFNKNQSTFNALMIANYYTVLSLSVFHDYFFSALFPYTIVALLICMRSALNKTDRLSISA
jgi:oligosaccharide repeat unit polymerase